MNFTNRNCSLSTDSNGYTLLEVLSVVTLIGLLSILVFPRFVLSMERNEVVYIGKLLKSDTELLRNEAISNGAELSIGFSENGYRYKLGEREIVRRFTDYQFKIDIPAPAPESEPEKNELDPSLQSDLNNSDSKEAAESDTKEVPPGTVIITGEGMCSGIDLEWQTIHYTGTLIIGSDGIGNWSYGQKGINK